MNKTSKIVCAAAIMLAGFMHCGAFAQSTQTQGDPASIMQSSNSCAGVYFAMAKMTNSTGIYWIKPPTNAQTGTFSNASGFPAPFTCSLIVTRKKDGFTWCTNNNNSVTFPATNSTSYALGVYVNSTTPPPTNGQLMTLQVTWQ